MADHIVTTQKTVKVKSVVEKLETQVCRVPTRSPESDGTLEWEATPLVLVRARADGMEGVGYTYTHGCAAQLIREKLAPVVEGEDVSVIPAMWQAMRGAVRNVQLQGLASMAISAVDIALWDLKAKLAGMPLVKLFGQAREGVPVYGSGGFTSYSTEELEEQLSGWVSEGISRVKMKVGREPEEDGERVRLASECIGPDAELFVDANGAYTRKQALRMAEIFHDSDVTWFEEPVSSNDLDGLRFLRDNVPPGMNVTAGEYGDTPGYFNRMLSAGAVDILQADVTRCGGYSGFFRAAALAEAYEIPLSAHTAPLLHLPVCCALPGVCHLEYFFDHVRIERMLFESIEGPQNGIWEPNLEEPGIGFRPKPEALEPFLARDNAYV